MFDMVVTDKQFLFSCVSGWTRPSRAGGARWTSRKQGTTFDCSLRASLDYLISFYGLNLSVSFREKLGQMVYLVSQEMLDLRF